MSTIRFRKQIEVLRLDFAIQLRQVRIKSLHKMPASHRSHFGGRDLRCIDDRVPSINAINGWRFIVALFISCVSKQRFEGRTVMLSTVPGCSSEYEKPTPTGWERKSILETSLNAHGFNCVFRSFVTLQGPSSTIRELTRSQAGIKDVPWNRPISLSLPGPPTEQLTERSYNG
jgi:hypothetical protein